MSSQRNLNVSGPIKVFAGRRLPEPGYLAGYSALIAACDLQVPLPRRLMATGEHHREVEEEQWRLLSPRHAPSPDLEGHLVFALKYEGLNLGLLKRLFLTIEPAEIEAIVQDTPTGKYARQLWFLYEWLTETRLDLPDASRGGYVPVVDTRLQYGVEGRRSSRHRVIDNLPGTAAFCPLVFRTDALDEFIGLDLAARARAAVARVPADILTRAAAFLLLKDSRSSYAIEGEKPPQDRVQRWGRAIGQAGTRPLDLTEILRLQEIVIGDARFVRLGLRTEGGFVGEHDRETQHPLPVHISARPADLTSLLDGMIAFAQGAAQQLDAVIAATVLAFGFVYVHPFQDGNGRIHRYLIHHVLSRREIHPPGLVFPISASIFERIEDYGRVLETYSSELLPRIEWEPTSTGNIRVTNDTADFYRFFDATPHAHFLYECVQKTIDEDLPAETDFLSRYDTFCRRVEAIVDMPSSTLDLLFRFVQQNDGKLSARAREREFAALKDDEAQAVEVIYAQLF